MSGSHSLHVNLTMEELDALDEIRELLAEIDLRRPTRSKVIRDALRAYYGAVETRLSTN
jgi:metal-responsive CopG/Arc/MetJ family transcriptional regulator